VPRERGENAGFFRGCFGVFGVFGMVENALRPTSCEHVRPAPPRQSDERMRQRRSICKLFASTGGSATSA
jgi:hypothetical protein